MFKKLSKGGKILLSNLILKGGGLMKYFILYVIFNDDYPPTEVYLKGKSIMFMEERIGRYSNGCLATSKGSIYTSNAKSAFIREIDLNYFPYLSKRDFATINETSSYDVSDLVE